MGEENSVAVRKHVKAAEAEGLLGRIQTNVIIEIKVESRRACLRLDKQRRIHSRYHATEAELEAGVLNVPELTPGCCG
jgi:hypothetical protein